MIRIMAGIVGKYLIRSFQEPSDAKTALPAPVEEDIVSDEPVCVDRQINGNIFCLDEVTIQREAHVSGNITCRRCVVSGGVDGSIHSSEYTELRRGAVVQGDITSASVEIESGAVINGCVSIEENMELPASVKPAEATEAVESGAGEHKESGPQDESEKVAEPAEKQAPPEQQQQPPAPPPSQNNIPDDRWW